MNSHVSPNPDSVNLLTGADLCRARQKPKKDRLDLAVELTEGRAALMYPTSVQAGLLLDLPSSAIATARQKRTPLSDKALAALIERVGAERLLDQLDRFTAQVTA